jgi:aryl-alcohol dehydrogenase-like predicted oxidoreductase
MGMSAFYTSGVSIYIFLIICMLFYLIYLSARTASEESNIAVFHEAVRQGVVLFNTATFYGPLNELGYGANLRLIKKCLHAVDRSKIQLMVKVAMDTRYEIPQ